MPADSSRSLREVFDLGSDLAANWREPLTALALRRLRHDPAGEDARAPRRCRPLPPDDDGGLLAAWTSRSAAALGYSVIERSLPEPQERTVGFTLREHAAIFINPHCPGGADYDSDGRLRRTELALTLLHELVHAIDPDDHDFSFPLPEAPAPEVRRAARAGEIVAVLATEALALQATRARSIPTSCGGSQLRYLAAILRESEPWGAEDLRAIYLRAEESVRILDSASRQEAWAEPAKDHGHAFLVNGRPVPLICGPAAHGEHPPPSYAAAAADRSRRATLLAERLASWRR